MQRIPLRQASLEGVRPGEALSLGAIMAILAIGIVVVVAYNLFKTNEGSVKLPGGFTFEWQ